jgi:D-hydroxyproline dehydrogenase subunit gamma
LNLRITEETQRGERCDFSFEGATVPAYRGETIAAALIADGQRRFRVDTSLRSRGPYCNMGTCFECVVQVRVHTGVLADAQGAFRLTRACLTRVSEGLEVRSVTGPRVEPAVRDDPRE